MANKRYYSIRTGNHEKKIVDLHLLRELFLLRYHDLVERGYFNEAFGYQCEYSNYSKQGLAGRDIASFFFLKLRKTELYPIDTFCNYYSEDDIFDVIELLYDLISDSNGNIAHDYCSCGGCSQGFDKNKGQQYFREVINDILQDYKDGWIINESGEIIPLADTGLDSLLKSPIPTYDPENISDRMKEAVRKFMNRHSNIDDKRESVRQLADILEFLRPKLNNVLMEKDENDLFMIANRFAIRHHNSSQKNKYDKGIWLTWIFYSYLSTLHVVIRLIMKNEALSN